MYINENLKRSETGVPEWFSLLSVHLLIPIPVMISQLMGLSSTSGSELTVWSLLGILSLPLSVSFSLSLSINQSIKNFLKQNVNVTKLS